MKEYLERIIKWYLIFCARLYVRRTKPKVIGVTGSVGKTTTKEAIAYLLKEANRLQLTDNSFRSGRGSMNAELGFPLSILGFAEVPAGLGWIPAGIVMTWRVCMLPAVDWLILEYGIDAPGDMSRLLKLARPDIAVMTRIAEVHTEGLGNLEGVYREKRKLLEGLKPHGVAIVPVDDRRLNEEVVPEKLTYGAESGADAQLLSATIKDRYTTLRLKVGKQTVAIKSQLLGQEQNKALLAALLVGIKFRIAPRVAAKILERFEPVNGRLRVITGKKEMMILDDTYNANLASMTAALEVLDAVAAKRRRVAILGEMRELGKQAEGAHRALGTLLPRYVDQAMIVGPYRELTVEAALKAGLGVGQINAFATTAEAIIALDGLLQPKDVILVKASQNQMRFERVVKALMAKPEQAQQLLVRQSRYWKKKP